MRGLGSCRRNGIGAIGVTRKLRAAIVLLLAAIAANAQAQTSGATASQASSQGDAWSLRASAATYVLPDDDDYVQPTFTADRGALHVEARYNYEDRHSVSGFVGWNLHFGETVTFELTPMFGAVAGDT